VRRVDIGIGVFLILFGLFAVTQSLGLPLFQRGGVPGAGMFPLVLSITLVVIGVLLVVTRLRARGDADMPFQAPSRTEGGRAGAAMVGLGVSILLLPIAGYFVSSVALVAFLLFGIERLRTWQAVVTTVALPAAFFLIFVVLLRVRLPSGFFGS
jgi:putative tricarboxylic transport membrane protein